MLRSQLLEHATMTDIYEHMAIDMIRDPEQRKQIELSIHREQQAKRTPEQQEAWILSKLNED